MSVIVRKSGARIDPEALFLGYYKMYFTTGTNGTRLGLFISKRSIIELYGGSVRAENNPDADGANAASYLFLATISSAAGKYF